jgi:hypothetical protein
MTQSSDQIIASQPGEVDRELTVERDGKRQHTVQRISQRFPTTVDDLWEACTQPDRLKRWFGEVLACEPPRSFRVTWEFAGDSSQVAVHLASEGDEARLSLEHEHTGDADSQFWTQFGPGATGVGWDLALLGLSLHVVAGQDRPGDLDAFARTTPAQQFVRAVSDRWGEASVLAGTPAEDAAAAANRTTAFFLGVQTGG